MVLSSRVRDAGQGGCPEPTAIQIPPAIRAMFDEELVLAGNQRLYVTLGQFSIVRLEREAQLVVPMVEYAIPTKECTDGGACCPEDPCEMFSRIPFPAQQFSPRGCEREGGSC